MPNGPFWQNSLSRRVRHLERSLKPNQRDLWRAYLLERFAGDEYREHRAQIIEALLSDYPQYTFSNDEYGYVVSWWQRERLAPAVVRIYSALWLAL